MSLAIPVQGMAAFVMPDCGPSHHGAALVTADAHPAEQLLHAGVHAAVQEPAAEAPADPGPDAMPGHDMLKCCSATCTMAMLAAMPTLQSLPSPAPAPLHPMDWRYRGVTLAGLDRPPKPLLA